MGKHAQKWITPFTKQCFVTAGVSLNMAGSGFVMGFTTALLQQLRRADSIIRIDDSSGSWIAAIPGFSVVFGNFIVSSLMSRYGRKTANLISIVPMIFGWLSIVLAKTVSLLLISRFIQGVCMGMCTSLGSILIGEYSSPRNRGAFLMTISVCIAMSVLVVHTMGSYLSWQITALFCAFMAVLDLIIVICSPESPCWLAEQGRYEECKRTFRWLRGDDEEDELKIMIEASEITREARADADLRKSIVKKIIGNLTYFKVTVRKKEFYKPIFIMIHIYLIAQWSGVNVLVPYAADLFQNIIGPDADIPILIITLDTHRIIANILAIYIIKKIKRRTMLFTAGSIDVFALLATAAYTFSKENNMLPHDHPSIGIILTHILMFAVATGTLSLCFIISGEIFPLEFKSLAGGISVLFYSVNLFLSVKTVPFFFKHIHVYGTYCVYAGIISYCLLIAWLFLPETKDRTLQDIEEEFRGRPLSPEELKSVQSLTSWKAQSADGRCNTPVL